MPEVYSSVMSEVIVTVAAESSVPLYRQIVDQIRLHIDSGALAPVLRCPPYEVLQPRSAFTSTPSQRPIAIWPTRGELN